MQFLSGNAELLQTAFLSALAIIIVLLGFIAVSILILLRRSRGRDLAFRLDSVDKGLDRCERSLRDEIAKNREEATLVARQGREETGNALKSFGDSLQTSMTNIADSVLKGMSGMATQQKEQIEAFTVRLGRLTESIETGLEAIRNKIDDKLKQI